MIIAGRSALAIALKQRLLARFHRSPAGQSSKQVPRDDTPMTGTTTINALGVGEATINYDGITESLRLRVSDADSWVHLCLAPGQITSGLGARQLQQDYSNANFSGN